jgi:PST family polysaccharide transporter
MIKKLSPDNSLILKNLSFLTILRFFNIGVKFFLVAYLVRVLGTINYGILTWTDSIIQYFIILINFGFNIYAAKYIVENKKNTALINQTTSAVFIIKIVLFIASFLALYILSFTDSISQYSHFLFLMLLMGIGEVFFPIWYFQGVEKLQIATYITVFSRLILVIGTILLVKSPEDLITHILLIVLSNLIMGILGYITLFRSFNFRFSLVSIKEIKKILKEAYMFFLGRFLSLTFNSMTIFLIGLFYTMDFVSGFDVALKIVLVCIIPFDMLQQAVFPTITRNKNKKALKKLIVISAVLGIIFSIIIYNFSFELLSLFGGEELREYSKVLKVLSPIPPIVALTFMLGTCTLVAFGHNKEFNKSLIISSIVYIFIVIILYLTHHLTFWNLVYLRLFSDVILMLLRVYYVYKRKIFSTE